MRSGAYCLRKTRYAVGLARQINTLLGSSAAAGAEIISADSRQVYRGMDIGTGKDLSEYEEIPYHLMDIVDAGEKYNIFEYQRDFEKAYKDLVDRGGIPILCGGSGLYIEAATCGYSLPEVPANPELRAELEQKSDEELIIAEAKKCGVIVTCEEHNVIGGLGAAVCECLSEKCPTPVLRVGVNDEFGRSGPAKELVSYYHLDAASIAEKAKAAVALKK